MLLSGIIIVLVLARGSLAFFTNKSFQDHDLFSRFLCDLSEHFNIDWIIVYSPETDKLNQQDFKRLLKLSRKCNKFISAFNDHNLSHIRGESFLVVLKEAETFPNHLSELLKTSPNIFWLQLAGQNISTQQFSPLYIPINCNYVLAQDLTSGKVKLVDIYNTYEGSELYSDNLGYWNDGEGLIISQESIFYRRDNFHGASLKIFNHFDKSGGIWTRQRDYWPGLWRAIAKRLNISSKYVGGSEDYDITLRPDKYARTSDKIESVFLFLPTLVDLFYRTPTEALVWNKYLRPFTLLVWISLIICSLASLAALFIYFKYAQRFHCGDSRLSTILFDTIYIILQQGSQISFSTTIKGSICSIQLLTSFFCFVVYSAVFISFITVVIETFPFTTLEGIIEHGRYNIILIRDKGYRDAKKMNHPTIQTLVNQFVLPEDQLADSFTEGFSRMCSTGDLLMVELLKTGLGEMKSKMNLDDCRISSNTIPFLHLRLGWIVRRHLPYAVFIRKQMLRLRESGAAGKIVLHRDHMEKTFDTHQILPPNSIRITDILPLLTVLLFGLMLSLIFLMGEVIFDTRKVKTMTRKNRLRRVVYQRDL